MPKNKKAGDSNPDAKYRVFISSTYIDNEARRKVVEDAVLSADMIPVGMERFTASDRPVIDECQRLAAECDLFVGIVAYRYGWIPKGRSLSITELEYKAAKSAKKPRFIFVLDPKIPVRPEADFDQGKDRHKKQEKLDRFKKRFSNDQTPAQFEESTLGTRVTTALQKWRAKQEGRTVQASRPDIAAEIETYLTAAEALHATVPLAGFKTRLRVTIDLEELYVPLNAMMDLRPIGDASFADAKDAEEQIRQSGRSRDINLIEAFVEVEKRKQRGLVVLGDPGSGKTTHLKRLLLKCLRDGSESLGLPQGMIPVFLPLRELDDLKNGLDRFIKQQLDQPHLKMDEGFGGRLLKRGKLLFLLDGLDEVADEKQRERVSQWISDAEQLHVSCRFVVTCRFAGYTANARLCERFMELHVRPLTEAQAQRFVTNWYRIVERGLADDPEQGEIIGRQNAAQLVARLKEPDFRARRVFEMTRNPLLLANLCLVHYDRKKLPQRRAELYEECIDVLLEHWRGVKGLKAAFTAKTGRRVLQPAAHWMHQKEGRIRAKADELAPIIQPAIKAAKYDAGDAKQFLKSVRDQSGLLTGWGDESYGFMHLGFQEYLAALEIWRRFSFENDRAPLEELIARFGESWWQEVTLLLLALENPPFKAFMHGLVGSDRFIQNQELLELCLDETAEVSDEPFVELVQQPANNDQAKWKRQLAALKILERLKSEQLAQLKENLADHPSDEIKAWLGGQKVKAEARTIETPRGDIELVRIEGGSFMMGGTVHGDEKPIHRVTVTSFYVGRYPVTNEQYGQFMKENGKVKEPEYWGDRKFNLPQQPVVGVSWHEAKAFAQWAGGRLPTEAEWEYACRAGTETDYYSGNTEEDLDRAGWYYRNSNRQTQPVGQKVPNAFGLYDMHGNVWEWIEDDWHDSYKNAPEDGKVWIDKPRGGGRVLRGGSWRDVPGGCRCAFRDWYDPGSRGNGIGCRIVLDLK